MEQLENAAAVEPMVTFSMPVSVAIQAFASLHVAIKSQELNMVSDFKRNTIPSDFSRITLEQLRAGAEIIEAAITVRVKPVPPT